MTKREVQTFTNLTEWRNYIIVHMKTIHSKNLDAAMSEGSSITLLTNEGEIIAKWSNGSGYVWEGRSLARLNQDVNIRRSSK